MRENDGDRDAFLAARHGSLVRAAFLLTGSQPDAEDLAQETAVRVVQRWRKVAAADDPVAYTNRVMLNIFLTARSRRWTREVPHAEVPDVLEDAGGFARVDDLDALRLALLALPPRQRAAVVLRHYEQRSEAATAELLGCSIGTVKSLTSRGLAALRGRTDTPHRPVQETP